MAYIVRVTIHEYYHKLFRFRSMDDAANFIEALLLHEADDESMKISILREDDTCEKDL